MRYKSMNKKPTPRVGVVLEFCGCNSKEECKRESHEYLIVYQNASKLWGFPKGRLNKYFDYGKEILEDRKKGACRELHEETGIKIESKCLNCNQMLSIKRGNHYHYYFIHEIQEKLKVKVDEIEIGTYKWMTLDELQTSEKSFFTDQVIKKLNCRS